MKIAVTCPDDLSIVLFCRGLIASLRADGDNEIVVLCDFFGGDESNDYAREIRSWGVRLRPTRFYRFVNPLADLRYTMALYRAFREENIDMVVNISTKPNIYGSIAGRLAGVDRIVCSVWGMGVGFSGYSGFRGKLLQRILTMFYRLAFRLSDRVWFTNKNDAEDFVARGVLPEGKLILSLNYVDTAIYSPDAVSPESLAKLRDELGLDPQNKVVIMVGRMSWAKGVREFVGAAEHLADKMPRLDFILVGPLDDGSPDSIPEAYLREKESSLANFRWLGFRHDIKELHTLSDLAVLPTYYREGGFPRGLTEPMALGKPVIACDSVHCRGVVDEGKNGYLVPVKDSAALADAIERLVSDEEKLASFGRWSRAKVVNELDEKVIVAQVVAEMMSSPMDRKKKEQEFHDRLRQVTGDAHVADTRWSPAMEQTIRDNELWVNMKYYAVERKSRAFVLRWYEENTKDKVVLDLCCGNGEDGVLIAGNWGRKVVGVDISRVSVENARSHASAAGVTDRIAHLVGDAEMNSFGDDSFDVITEYGALHHVDTEAVFAEMARLLRPGGKAICQEALGHNPIIYAYRRRTPHLRTEWEVEHILRKESIDLARRYFDHVEMGFYHLASLAAVPFRNTVIFRPLLSLLEGVDAVLLRLPFIKWQAWQVVFVLSGPRKSRC